jgi:hypothetical protein
MALVPELAPDDETHLLAADRALTVVLYDVDQWEIVYATVGGSGRESIRMAHPPAEVRAGGDILFEYRSPEEQGPGWYWDATSRVLTVVHTTSPVQVAQGITAAPIAPESGAARQLVLAPEGDSSGGFALYLAEPGPVHLDVFDLRGRRVRRLLAGAILTAGRHEMSWDGRNGRGAPVASGVYLIRAASAGTQAVTRLVIAR